MDSNAIRFASRGGTRRASPAQSSADLRPVEAAAPSRRVSALVRLTVTNFRSYPNLSLELTPQPVVLTGANGAGKTNLLEAVSFLAPGRGLRSARLGEVERQDGGEAPGSGMPWAVAAEIDTPEGRRAIGTGRDPQTDQTGGARRVVRIDGAPAKSQQALAELLRVVWLTPQMDGLFRGGGSERRRFLDRLVYGIDAEHAGRLSAYEQALRERSRLLKEGSRDEAWLGALEQELAAHGVAVAAARRLLVDRLTAVADSVSGAFPEAELDLAGEVDDLLKGRPALAVEDDIKARLRAERRIDAEAGGARSGPHRSDLLVRHKRNDQAAALCSTGEQKALLIAIVLAHARLVGLDRGTTPILLLDEVIAHLDEDRRRALFEDLLSLGAQAWMTGTDPDPFAPLGARAQVFHVETGRLAPIQVTP